MDEKGDMEINFTLEAEKTLSWLDFHGPDYNEFSVSFTDAYPKVSISDNDG